MGISKVTITKTQGLGGRPSQNSDGISALVFYSTSVPSGLTGNIQQISSVVGAESFGVTKTAYPVEHYHISEAYRMNEDAVIWLAMFAMSGGTTHSFNELYAVQQAAQDSIRQFGVYSTKSLTTGNISALQTVMDTMEGNWAPASAIFGMNLSGMTLSSLTNISTLNANKVSVVIGQDAGGRGAELYATKGFSIGTVGAALGLVSKAAVQENIGNTGKFNISGTDLDKLAFANGTSYTSVTRSELDILSDKGYIFCLKYPGLSGTYFNDSWTASNGDFYSIENNRVIDKAVRNLRAKMLSRLNENLYVDKTGKLSEDTIASYTTECNRVLEAMLRAGELSEFKVTINPEQDVVSTSKLEIGVKLIPAGVAREIAIKIGFALKA
jgi:hypothetical protein